MIADFVITTYMQSYMRKMMKLQSFASDNDWSPPRNESPQPSLLYLHVPFCEELCPFCSFNRVKFNPAISRGYFESLRREIRRYAELGYQFDSVYAGGGTPVIQPDELETTLQLVRDLWPIKRISTETNPNHLTPEMLARLRDLGITRLSVGIQSFDDEMLKVIGRYDRYGSGEQNVERLALARGYFDTLNVDMIFNYPSQTEQMLREDLDTVRRVRADQITFYPLMSAKASKEHARRENRVREQSFYRLIRQQLADGYEPSSAWCFSRIGSDGQNPDQLVDEYIVDYEDYAGLGSGSFGYLNGVLYSNTFDIRRYTNTLAGGQLPIVARREFSRYEQMRYDLLMNLFGGSLPVSHFRRKYGGVSILRLWKELLFFAAVGAVRIRDGEIRLTEKGYYLWVVMMREFFTGVNLFRDHCMSEVLSAATAMAEPRTR